MKIENIDKLDALRIRRASLNKAIEMLLSETGKVTEITCFVEGIGNGVFSMNNTNLKNVILPVIKLEKAEIEARIREL